MLTIPKAESYGAVLFNAKGEVLLREPTGHFGGYAWTFAKGRPDRGENPADTALRELREETGYNAELLGILDQVFAGTTTSSAFFLAGPIGRQAATDSETSATRWVSIEEATQLISQTKTKTGRYRDLAILRAAQEAARAQSISPRVCREDWQVLDMPDLNVKLTVSHSWSQPEVAKIARGYLPQDMDDRWFAWFDGKVLHMHRSWTGHCIYKVAFEQGNRAVSVTVNSDPREYSMSNDEANSALELICDLLI